MKLCAVGESTQRNLVSYEKAHSEFKRLRRRRVMNGVSSMILLVYCIMLLPPLCFCINCPLERVELDLSHPPPLNSSHLLSTGFSADRQCLVGVGRFGVRGMGCPTPHATSWKGDRQCLGGGPGGIGVRGMGCPAPMPQG
jgi:hypothetical protein